MNTKFLNGLAALLLGTLACRPVIAVGWQEFLVLGLLMAFLLGPPIYKFMKRMENFWGRQKKDK